MQHSIESRPRDLSHLHETARRVARLPDEERLRYVRADRWIGYPCATEALERLETLFGWPVKQRMPNLLLIGPTNNGKSMIIEKFRRSHPPISHEDREEIPVLVVQMPSEPSVARFYTGSSRGTCRNGKQWIMEPLLLPGRAVISSEIDGHLGTALQGATSGIMLVRAPQGA